MARLCRWFGVPRRTIYYKPVKSAPWIDLEYAEPIQALIEASPSFGNRTVMHMLGVNKNTVQRVFQLMGWQVRKQPILAPRQCLRSPGHPTSAGRPLYAGSGQDVTAGQLWPW